MKPMYCTKCGCKTKQDSIVCPQCGEKLCSEYAKPHRNFRNLVALAIAVSIALIGVYYCENDKRYNSEITGILNICSECDGTGYLQITCTNCSGEEMVECVECEGSGKIICNWCYGRGGNDCISCNGTAVSA